MINVGLIFCLMTLSKWFWIKGAFISKATLWIYGINCLMASELEPFVSMLMYFPNLVISLHKSIKSFWSVGSPPVILKLLTNEFLLIILIKSFTLIGSPMLFFNKYLLWQNSQLKLQPLVKITMATLYGISDGSDGDKFAESSALVTNSKASAKQASINIGAGDTIYVHSMTSTGTEGGTLAGSNDEDVRVVVYFTMPKTLPSV